MTKTRVHAPYTPHRHQPSMQYGIRLQTRRHLRTSPWAMFFTSVHTHTHTLRHATCHRIAGGTLRSRYHDRNDSPEVYKAHCRPQGVCVCVACPLVLDSAPCRALLCTQVSLSRQGPMSRNGDGGGGRTCGCPRQPQGTFRKRTPRRYPERNDRVKVFLHCERCGCLAL